MENGKWENLHQVFPLSVFSIDPPAGAVWLQAQAG
jgi:hypothetical protein